MKRVMQPAQLCLGQKTAGASRPRKASSNCVTCSHTCCGEDGAVRLRDGKFFFHRETDKFNGATFFAFLKALDRVRANGTRRVVVITDNARYHHAKMHRSWREKHQGKFALDYLPAYSPDLNPIDRAGLEAHPAAMRA